MVTTCEFLFCFGNVERSAVHFGGTRNKEEDECNETEDRDLENPPVKNGSFLAHRDAHEVRRPRNHHDEQENHCKRDFVADHLGATAERTEQGILVVTAPAAKQDAEHAKAVHRDNQGNAHRNVGDHEILVERNQGADDKRRNQDNERSQVEHELVRATRGVDFLEEHLDDVCDGLERSVPTETHRTQAALHVGAYLSFHVNENRG